MGGTEVAKKVARVKVGAVAPSNAPKVTAIQNDGGKVVVHIKVGGNSKIVSESTSSERDKLNKIFSDDLVNVILSEASIPKQKRSQTLDRIAMQYKSRMVAQRVKKAKPGVTVRVKDAVTAVDESL